MAKKLKLVEPITPVEAPVAIQAPVATAVVPVSPPVVKPTASLKRTSPRNVYSNDSIRQIDLPAGDSAMDMKLEDMEKALSKASTRAELNQANIMNQRVGMGIITGQAAHQSRLDVARLNAFNSLYQNKLAEYDRQQAELAPYKQLFASTFGYLPDEFGDKEKEMLKAAGLEDRALKLAAAQKSLRGGGGSTQYGILANAAQNLPRGEGGYADYSNYMAQKDAAVSSGKISPDQFDSQYGYLLSPDDQKRFNVNVSGASTQTERLGTVAGEIENNIYGSIDQNTGQIDLNNYLTERQKFVSAGGTIPNFNSAYGGLLNPNDQPKAGIQVKQDQLTQWELESAGWQWLASDEAKNMSDEQKAQELKANGLDPTKFGIYAG